MEVKKEISNFWELKENSWSGALDTLKDIENADKEDELMQLLEDVFVDRETPTETEVNDFLWFEREYIYENVGLNSNGELPTVFDELEDSYLVNEDDLENMKESGVFSDEFLSDVKARIEESYKNTDPHRHTGCISLSKSEFETEEQAQFAIDEL